MFPSAFHTILLPVEQLNSSLTCTHFPLNQRGENSLGLGGSKTGFQSGEEKVKKKIGRAALMSEGRRQKGTRLLFYLFCLFAIKDPTFLHSWNERSYMTLSPASWPPNPALHVWSDPWPLRNSKSRATPKLPFPNLCLRSSPSLPDHFLDLTQIRNTQIPLHTLPLGGPGKVTQLLKLQGNEVITDATTRRDTEG